MDGGSWHCTGGSDQDHPQETEMQKGNWLSGETLQIAIKRREVKGKGKEESYTHLNAEFQRIARRDKKPFLSDQCKEIEENNRMGKTKDLFKKMRDTKGTLHAKMGTIKDGNGMDLTEADGNPLQCSCLENPRDGGVWWAAIYGITQSRTRLKWLSSSSSNRSRRY